MFGIWSIPEITQAIASALRDAAAALDEENAVRGLDAVPELALHPIVAAALQARDFGVWREWPYPSFALRNPGRPHPRDRDRCDVVLAPAGAGPPADPVAVEADRADAASTLFAAQTLADLDAADAPEPEDLFWLEIKSVGQFVIVDGAQRANGQYASELIGAGRDLRKLAADPRVLVGGLALIHFTADEATARHDQLALLNRWLDRAWPVREPEAEGFPIADRIGNRWCSVMLTPVR